MSLISNEMRQLNSESAQCPDLPDDIPVRLYPHQRTSVNACMKLEHERKLSNTQLGVLTDIAGSGKSFVILSLILFKKYPELCPPQDNTSNHDNTSNDDNAIANDNTNNDNEMPTKKTTIIVVSHGLLSQWTHYVNLFSGRLKTFIVSQYVNVCNLCTHADIDEYDIILVTNTLYASLTMFLMQKNITITRLVVDDADELLNNNQVATKANFYWFLISSDFNISFDILSYNVIIDSLYYHQFISSVIIRNENSFVLQSFEHASVSSTNILCTLPHGGGGDQHGHLLKRSVQILLERGDVKGAVKKLDKSQIISREYIDERALALNDNKCSICYEDISMQSVTPCCMNSFCFRCIGKWLVHTYNANTSCPLCRAPLSIQQVMVVYDDISDGGDESAHHTKVYKHPSHGKLDSFRILMHKLSGVQDAKILVFVMNPYTLMNVKTVMNELHITNYRLRGNNKVINTNIVRYNHNDGRCKSLIICPMTANTGISLPLTTDIVFFDMPGDSELEIQMIGRAHRLGRKQQLRVWNISYDFDILDRHRDIPTLQSVDEIHIQS